MKRLYASSLLLSGIAGGGAPPRRALACNLAALSAEQRTRHAAATERLLRHGIPEELPDAWILKVDRVHVSAPELAEWVADEARCCEAIDFELELPAFGPLTLRVGGGADVKAFIAAELGM